MKLLNEKQPTEKVLYKQGRFHVIADKDRLFQEIILRASLANTEDAFNDLKSFVDNLKDSADKAWDQLMTEEDVKEAKMAIPEDLCSLTLDQFTPALEAGAFYIPDMTMVEGEVDARIAVNSWKAELAEAQSRVSVWLNRFRLNQKNGITETEQKTSNVFNQLMFFISNDPDEHGKLIAKQAETTTDIVGFRKAINKLKDNLLSLNDFDKPENCTSSSTVLNEVCRCNLNRSIGFMKWMSIFNCALAVLNEREQAAKREEENVVYEL